MSLSQTRPKHQQQLSLTTKRYSNIEFSQLKQEKMSFWFHRRTKEGKLEKCYGKSVAMAAILL